MHAIENPKPADDFGVLQWYKTSNSTPTGFNINSSDLRWISKRMKQKATSNGWEDRVEDNCECVATLTEDNCLEWGVMCMLRGLGK